VRLGRAAAAAGELGLGVALAVVPVLETEEQVVPLAVGLAAEQVVQLVVAWAVVPVPVQAELSERGQDQVQAAA
jgi:hypothetical protein